MKSKFRVFTYLQVTGMLIRNLALAALVASCTVTNNLYINNPSPLPKGDAELYAGIGTGLQPKIDSIADNGEVFSNKLKGSYNLVVGTRIGITNLMNLMLHFHFPEIVGGVGVNIRPQISLFPQPARFNLAFAADLGGTLAKDSIEILESSYYVGDKVRGASNADFSVPFSYKTGKNTAIMLTPRYSFNTFYLRREFDVGKSKRMNASYPALSLGFRYKRIHLETTVLQYKSMFKFTGGFVYLLSWQKFQQELDYPEP